MPSPQETLQPLVCAQGDHISKSKSKDLIKKHIQKSYLKTIAQKQSLYHESYTTELYKRITIEPLYNGHHCFSKRVSAIVGYKGFTIILYKVKSISACGSVFNPL